jgi:predicted metal-dependent peptidase
VWDAKTKEGKALSPAEIADVERQIDSGVQEAARAEKSIGQGSSDVTDGILKGLAKIDLPWHEILKDYLLETSAQDYSWSNPNRRFVGQGLYLPGPASVPNGELVFAIDVSCSLEKEELENIAGHINEIVDAVQPLKTYVIYCDTTVKNPVAEFELGEDIELKYYRGGGTAFAPPFNWCLANDISPSALVYFTDGYGSVGGWPELDEEPDYPVVWATSGTTPSFRGCNEFGEVIEI